MFFTFEGGEGVGKTTLIASLEAALIEKGWSVLSTKEPGGTALGQKIRKILLDQTELKIVKKAEFFLFLADRAQHMEEKIIPFLNQGGVVLCDRFIDSSFAYQHLTFEDAVLNQLNLLAIDARLPQKTFYLDLDPKIGLERIQKKRGTPLDRMEKKDLEFHEKVRNRFLSLCAADPNRMIKIDASVNQEQLHQLVLEKLCFILSQKNC